jgi:flagellin
MGLRIQNNIAAFNSHRNLKISDAALSRSLERLSSGYRINKASDDAAGLAVSMRFRAQIRSLQQASRNAAEANSMLQVADGAGDQITNILQRMKELATQAASSNTGSADRTNIAAEVDTLEGELDRIATSTKYAGTTLLDGAFGSLGVSTYGSLVSQFGIEGVDTSSAAVGTEYGITVSTAGNNTMTITDGATTQTVSITTASTGLDSQTLDFTNLGIKVDVNALFSNDTLNTMDTAASTMTTSAATVSSFQLGYENAADNRIAFSIGDMTLTGLNADVNVSTLSGAQTALTTIDAAIDTLADARAEIGRTQNQFGFASANLSSTIENISASESVIRDADMAFETVAFTKNQILLQAGAAMLAQANASPQVVLSLLG